MVKIPDKGVSGILKSIMANNQDGSVEPIHQTSIDFRKSDIYLA